MNDAAVIPREAKKASQNNTVGWAATMLDPSLRLERSLYIRYALIHPPTIAVSANTEGNFSQNARARPSIKITNMNEGTSHSKLSRRRARSKPLAESLRPTQLICIHGKKKQINTNPARLRLTRLELSIALFSSSLSAINERATRSRRL